MHCFLVHKKSHLKCQMWFGQNVSPSSTLPLTKTTFPLAFCINSVGCGSQMYARILTIFRAPFWGFLPGLPLPNSFDQKLKLYFGVAPTGKATTATANVETRDMFSATAATKAFSHKEPTVRGQRCPHPHPHPHPHPQFHAHPRCTRRLSEHSMSAKCTCNSTGLRVSTGGQQQGEEEELLRG